MDGDKKYYVLQFVIVVIEFYFIVIKQFYIYIFST